MKTKLKTLSAIACVALALFAVSCKPKNQPEVKPLEPVVKPTPTPPSPPTKPPTIYSGGYIINASNKNVATLWKNGAVQTPALSDGTNYATVNSIAVVP